MWSSECEPATVPQVAMHAAPATTVRQRRLLLPQSRSCQSPAIHGLSDWAATGQLRSRQFAASPLIPREFTAFADVPTLTSGWVSTVAAKPVGSSIVDELEPRSRAFTQQRSGCDGCGIGGAPERPTPRQLAPRPPTDRPKHPRAILSAPRRYRRRRARLERSLAATRPRQ